MALTRGEAWARTELARLRARRFGPRAMASFLAASRERAREVRRARPDLAAQERRWALMGAAAWLGLAALGREPFRGHAGRGLVWWTATVVMLDWHLGMVETLDGRARMLGPADAATLARAWLVPAVGERPTPALCALGFATDALDGALARAAEPTRLGRDFDGIADAAFAAAILHGAHREHLLDTSATMAESARLALGAGLAIVMYFGQAQAPDRRVLEAGRASAGLRAAGYLAVLSRRARLGSGLLVGAATVKLVALLLIAPGSRRGHREDSVEPSWRHTLPSPQT